MRKGMVCYKVISSGQENRIFFFLFWGSWLQQSYTGWGVSGDFTERSTFECGWGKKKNLTVIRAQGKKQNKGVKRTRIIISQPRDNHAGHDKHQNSQGSPKILNHYNIDFSLNIVSSFCIGSFFHLLIPLCYTVAT